MKNKKHFSSLIFCLTLSVTLMLNPISLSAQNQFNLSELEEGQLILNLSANEQTNVEQDTLNVTLEYTTQGRNTTALQDEVNEAIKNALNILEDTENIDYATQQYHVYIFEPARSSRNDIENPVWRAQQRIMMTSMDSKSLLEVTGRLQEAGLHIVGMNYSLSSDKYEEVADSLMSAALMKLQARAEEVARTLNKSRADMLEVTINGGRNFPVAMGSFTAEARSASATLTAPVGEPGDTQVNLSVSARALLSP